MQLTYLHIHNFKSIRDMEIRDIDRALILVGKNNTGKTSILDAVYAVCGCYQVPRRPILTKGNRPSASTPPFPSAARIWPCSTVWASSASIGGTRCGGRSSTNGFPSFSQGELCFTFHVNKDGKVRYEDISRKNNPYIPHDPPQDLPDHCRPGLKTAPE